MTIPWPIRKAILAVEALRLVWRWLLKNRRATMNSEDMVKARDHYEAMRMMVKLAQDDGRLSKTLTREEAIDWAYGNVAMHNPKVTREMVAAAYDAKEQR